MAAKDGDSLLKKVISLSDLASLCVCSERTLQRLTKSGALRQAKDRERRIMRGRYVLGDAMPAFVEHLRDSLASDDPHETAYVQARSRRMTALAESEELRVKHQRGELLECQKVDFAVSMILRALRDNLRGLPSQLMHQLQAMTDAKLINKTLKDAIDRVLRKTADGDLSAQLRRHDRAAEVESSNGAAEPDEPAVGA